MNIKDIAALAGTSVATISRVINCDVHVAEKTRKRVLEIIANTGYKPNLVGRALTSAHNRRGMVLAILPGIINPYFSRVLEGIEQRANQADYDVMECITYRKYETERRYLEFLKTDRVDGIILFTSTLSNDELDKFAVKRPIVQCDAGGENIAHISFTCIDNVAAASDGVSYLAELGHLRIAMMNGLESRAYELQRQAGYERALRRAGIAVDKRLIVTSDYDCFSASAACREVLGRANPPTAIFCVNDMMAAGAIKCLLEDGLTPGRDVDVVGFDGGYFSDLVTPTITSIEQPAFEIGKTAFDLLLERINEPGGMCKKVVMPHKLVVKQSTRSG